MSSSQIWAENCPENFENRAALVGAEIARLEGRELDAERLYEQAIRSARDNGFVHNEALAYELAAALLRGARVRGDRGYVSAERPLRLCALGRRRQGAATRRAASATSGGRAERRRRRARSAAPVESPRPRDRDQGVASRLGRDRARKAHRHAHAHRDRAGGRRARLVDPSARGRAADRGGSHDRRR